MRKIAFFDAKPYDSAYFDEANKDYGFDIHYFGTRLQQETAALAQGFDGVVAFVNDEVDAAVIDRLSAAGVGIVALRAAGYNNVDLKAAWGRLRVVRVPAYSPHAVAEHAVALLLSLNRKIHKAYLRTREGNFSLAGLEGFDMHGRTAGIIGTGKIGRVAARILKGFGMRVLASDPYPDPAWAAAEGVEYVDRDRLLAESDIVSLHCPLTPENMHLIGDEAIGRMKKGAIIINTGRGALIDAKALIRGLKSGRLGGAGLDVYEEEDEYFFEDHSSRVLQDDVLARLLSFPNVIVTGHQAFLTAEALNAIARTTLANLKAFFDGAALETEVCYKCGAGTCPRKEGAGRCWPDAPSSG